jgi:hypothetical protein
MSHTAEPCPQRVVVIGDVGGHLVALERELRRLGAHPETGDLPAGLVVVQVGDLIHRGPDSSGVVRLVDRYLHHQPDQWVQLVGNHEAQYLHEPVFRWPERLDRRSADRLRDWWHDGRMQVAATVETPAGPHLVTHAGVTASFWSQVLDRPSTAAEAVAVLNSMPASRQDELFRAGKLLHGARRDAGPVGPLWACAATELLPSWVARELPFSQVHGHTSVFDWRRRTFRVDAEIARRTVVDESARHELTSLDGGQVIGVDPGHELAVATQWSAWEARLEVSLDARLGALE